MTTISTQTVDGFQSEDMSPPPPPLTEEDMSGDLTSIYHGTWPVDKVLWHSGPSSVGGQNSIHSFHSQESANVASYRSTAGSASYRNRSHNQQLGTKVEMVYSLLSMLGSHDKDDMSRKLLSMSSSVDSCVAMRQSGCLPLLIELLHGDDKDGCMERQRPSRDTRRRASKALHNIIHSHPDDKRGRREARVLRLLEQIRAYCNMLGDPDSGSDDDQASPESANADQHPVSSMAMLMKLSFDEEHRHAMCQLGGLQTIAELVQVDYDTHSNMNDHSCITLRRYAGMALTNLTFGDGTNKALLCSLKSFMRALVAQLHSPSEDLRQVIASVLRNLSWRADQTSKKSLREVGAVPTLMKAAMEAKKESTLKSILSALWNLSAHCSMNKADICTVDGSLGFLVDTLTYKSPSKTHAIVENGGGILRNISSHVAVREDYRAILRRHNCLPTLLQHLLSPSLTIVSNACGTLWNISARCSEDQQALWDLGAVGMLRNLVHSKHKMISMGSSAALKNLLAAKPGGLAANADRQGSAGPSLHVRKQRALEAELDQNLAETCENLDSPKTSPTHHWGLDNDPRHSPKSTTGGQTNGGGTKAGAPVVSPYQLHGRMYHSVGGHLPPTQTVSRSESKESIVSTQSDSSHDRLRNLNLLLRYRQERLGHNDEGAVMPTMASLGLDQRLADVPPAVMESRIQYVMQEVTRQIALENQDILSSDYGSSGRSYLKSSSKTSAQSGGAASNNPVPVNQRATSANNNDQPVAATANDNAASGNTIFGKYPNLSSMMENLNLDEDAGSDDNDKPVNYSLKYSEEAGQQLEGRKKKQEGNGKEAVDGAAPPKVDNDVAAQFRQKQDVNSNEVTPPFGSKVLTKRTNMEWQSTPKQSDRKSDAAAAVNHHNDVYSHYAETDLDDPDQPTNYSLRYTEDNDTTDDFQPPAPEDEKPYFTREYPGKGPSVHDDTYKSYCTEDTPLNFSTATSMTDLREIHDAESLFTDESDGNKSNVPQSPAEGATTESGHADEENGAPAGGDAVINASINPSMPPLAKSTPDPASSDKVVNYCMEGTPICFSRVSSLSSIHSNDLYEDGVNLDETGSRHQGSTPPIPNLASQNHSLANDVSSVAGSDADDRSSTFEQQEGKNSVDQHEAKTVTFGKDQFAEETPLMFSRCSSLGSLSSFEQHSIHDDRSSVISDFSRRASEVVSPSDLPDSPGQTMPSSPRNGRAPLSFTGKVNSECTIQPRAKRMPPPPPPRKSSINKNNCFVENEQPAPLARGNSDVESDDHGMASNKSSPGTPGSEECNKSEKQSPECDSQDEKDVISANLSESEDNEEDLLAACINSAMPNNARQQGGHRHRHNNSAKLSSRINVLDSENGGGLHRLQRTSGSSIPVKANNVRIGHSSAAVAPGVGGMAMAAAPSKSVNDKTINTTPADLQPEEVGDNGSDTSSVFDTDDNDKMLAQCIQSGMPKSNNGSSTYSPQKVNSTNLLDRRADAGAKDRYAKTQFRHAYASNKMSNVAPAAAPPTSVVQPRQSVYRDTVTVFADEGTPLNFSTATSLSDLTVDDMAGDDSDHPKSNEQPRPRERSAPDLNLQNLTSGYMKSDAPHGGQSVNDSKNYTADDKFGTDKNRGRINMGYRNPNMAAENNSHDICLGASQRHEFDDDVPRSYAVEGTPMILSRGSSLSSLNMSHDREYGDRPTSNFGVSHQVHHQHDHHHQSTDQHTRFEVEGTPACFSRNSSLSSLSVESLGVEPTPSEQALLDECISSGMPKTRSSSDYRGGRRSGSRLPCPVSAKERHANGAMKLNVSPHKMDSIEEQSRSGQPDTSPDREATKVLQNSPNTKTCEHAAAGEIKKDADAGEKVAATKTVVDKLPHVLSVVEEEERSVDEPLQQSPGESGSGANSFGDDEAGEEMTAAGGRRLIELEATRVAVAVQNMANLMPDDMEQSLVSQSSEWIESVKPPSIMGDVLSASMINSANSDGSAGNSGRRGSSAELPPPVPGVRGAKCPSRTRTVPELVVRALGGSLENLSLRGSFCVNGDLIDNVKPPSIMEDVDMSSSTYSVCSIVSEVADQQSEEGISMPSDMIFGCIKSVVAMAEMYVRDGCMAGSDNVEPSMSDIIENVNPPSALLEMTDTLNDCTEVGTDTLENNNDTDIEDDLPDDHESPFGGNFCNVNNRNAVPSRRLHHHHHRIATHRMANPDQDVHVNEMVDFSHEPDLDFLPDVDDGMLNLREDANLVLSTLNEIQFNEFAGEESLSEDMLIECETLSLVSNESDSSESDNDDDDARDSSDTPQGTPPLNRGPRIVKPGNREANQPPTQQLAKEEDRSMQPKSIRGRRKNLYPRQQLISSFANTRFTSPKPKDMAVKPTRTSALRATQSQQKVTGPPVPPASCDVANKGPEVRRPPMKSKSSLGGSGEIKVVRAGNGGRPIGIERNYDSDPVDTRDKKPKPPIKQGTFTKDKPSHHSPPKISPTKTRIPTFGVGGAGVVADDKPVPQKRNDVAARAVTSAALRTRLGQSRSLDGCKGIPPTSRQPPNKSGAGKLPVAPPRRVQSSPPVNRDASTIRTTAIRNSPSSHSLNGGATGAKTPLSKTGSLNGALNTTKRSSSNASLCSNTSSNTTNSRKSLGGSGGNISTRRNVGGQQNSSVLWKSSDGGSSKDASPSLTPKEGLSRSSTYEKIPTFGSHRLPAAEDGATNSGTRKGGVESSAGSTVNKSQSKENIRLVAETRLQRYAARKAARILARKNSEGEGSIGSGCDDEGQLSIGDNSEGTPASSGGEEVGRRVNGSRIQRPAEASEQESGVDDGSRPANNANNNSGSESTRGPASAIVPPFNYTPSTRTGTKGHPRSLIPTLNHMVVPPCPRPRDTFLHPGTDGDGDSKQPCLVTTV